MKTYIKATGSVIYIAVFFLLVFIATESKADVKQLYNTNCAVCHGVNGTGDIPGTPDFTKLDKVYAERIKYGYDSGKGGLTMPAKGGNPNLTDDDIAALVKYIQQFNRSTN